jgi:hypothetical protein
MLLSALLIQSVLILAVGLVAWMFFGPSVALATGYGGLVAAANSGLLAWRWQRGRTDYHCDGQRHLKVFHRSSLERFFVVGILFWLGMAWLRLQVFAVLVGFMAGLVIWGLAMATRLRSRS